LYPKDNITLGEERGTAIIMFPKKERIRRLRMLKTPEKIRDLQRKLCLKAKHEKTFRFYLLYDKVYRRDILRHAYRLERANGGAAGVDGITFDHIEKIEGTQRAKAAGGR
jgi:hypothetical protein